MCDVCILFLSENICSAVAAGIRGGFFKMAMTRLNIRIRNYLFASLAQQEIGFFDVTKTGQCSTEQTLCKLVMHCIANSSA